MNTAALKQERAGKLEALSVIQTRAANENRDLTDAETAEWTTAEGEVRALDTKIGRAEFLAEAERRADAVPANDDHAPPRDLAGYSVAKAIQGALNGKLEGREAEWHQELARGREMRGTLMIPAQALLEHRAVTTTTPVAGPGSNLIGRDIMPVREHPRPKLVIETLGATVMRNLVGDVDLPVLAESGTVGWVAEHVAVTRSDPKFGKSSLSPNTVGGEYEVSRRMILQAAESIEDLLRRDLGSLLRQALDLAAITGTGGTQPLGILNTSGITAVTASAALSDTTADLIAAIELDDLTGSRGFLTNPGAMRVVRKTKDGDGKVIPAVDLFHGERV